MSYLPVTVARLCRIYTGFPFSVLLSYLMAEIWWALLFHSVYRYLLVIVNLHAGLLPIQYEREWPKAENLNIVLHFFVHTDELLVYKA
jgi:hypothetical protein